MALIPASEYGPYMRHEFKSGAFWRDCFAELLSSFLLVASAVVLRQAWYSSPDQAITTVHVAVGTAFLWAGVGYGLGDFGGAHMSSAVTMAMFIRAEVTFLRALFYWIMQLAAAIGATFFVYAVTPSSKRGDLGVFILADGVTWWQGLLIEALVTTILCLAALGTRNVARKGYVILHSLPIGMAAGIATFMALAPTRACLSPTQASGSAIVYSIMMDTVDDDFWKYHWVYWAGPMAGAFLAALLYWIFDSADKKEFQTPVYGSWLYTNKEQQPLPDSTGNRDQLGQDMFYSPR